MSAELRDYQDKRGWLAECYFCGSFEHLSENHLKEEVETKDFSKLDELEMFADQLEKINHVHKKGHKF